MRFIMRPNKSTTWYLRVLPSFTFVFCILLKTVYSQEECENITTLLTISFSPGGLTNNEMMGLMVASIALNFQVGLSSGLPIKENTTWRIPHVKEMGIVTKLLCPKDYVRPEFINILLNFIMVYYNNMEEKELTPKGKLFWENLEKMYSECENNIQPLTFSSIGGLITEYESGEDKGSVFIANEKADNYPVLDYMLEGMWYMFELTAATCYKSGGSTIYWFSEFFYYFRKDFTNQFKKWWVNPGETNYGILFGDIDLYENLYNLRACTVATFQHLDIQDILLVRPVIIGDDEEHFAQSLNHRTMK